MAEQYRCCSQTPLRRVGCARHSTTISDRDIRGAIADYYGVPHTPVQGMLYLTEKSCDPTLRVLLKKQPACPVLCLRHHFLHKLPSESSMT